MGWLAYAVMCVEKCLVYMHPDHDWCLLAKTFWVFPRRSIADWMWLYGDLIPDGELHESKCTDDIKWFFTQDEFQTLVQQYRGITNGDRNDPNDCVTALLRIPYKIMYEINDDGVSVTVMTILNRSD